MKPRTSSRRRLVTATAAACALLMAWPSAAQYASDGAADWQEDTVPPPPPYSGLDRQLIDIDMPRASSVRVGIDPDTLRINHQTGIVRYVAVARGPSAVNASYEGIRCSTGEYRVYARQVQGGPWISNENAGWKAMSGQSNVMVQYPLQLARGGLCVGASARQTVNDMVRELRSGNRSLYQ